MAYCSKCGKEVDENAEFCSSCGNKLNSAPIISAIDEVHAIRFVLTFFLGFIGSFIINHTNLKPVGWKSRTYSYLIWGIITFGLYDLVASICNFVFDPNKESNIGYMKD